MTGGVKTPVIPSRGTLQDFVTNGLKTTIPAFIGLISWVMLPLAFYGFVVRRRPGPVIRTRTPCTALPPLMTLMCIFVTRPT